MEVFKMGQIVVYDTNGLCTVKEIKRMSFTKSEASQEYYVLSPLSNPTSTYYIPVYSEKAVSKLRLPFTKDEIETMLLTSAENDWGWIENRQLRSDSFHSILRKGLCPELISLIRCIYSRKINLSEKGKKISASDESVFTTAEKMFNEEFAFVLGIDKEKVSSYIENYLSSKA